VAHRDAFVAVAAVDLEHALETADQQALEVQLGRDAQEHFLVQRVVVGLEGLGVGAARNGVQHGRLDFQEVVGTMKSRSALTALLRATKRLRADSSVIRST
jgi:hypothetical protein